VQQFFYFIFLGAACWLNSRLPARISQNLAGELRTDSDRVFVPFSDKLPVKKRKIRFELHTLRQYSARIDARYVRTPLPRDVSTEDYVRDRHILKYT
jgi:hypothetical protein